MRGQERRGKHAGEMHSHYIINTTRKYLPPCPPDTYLVGRGKYLDTRWASSQPAIVSAAGAAALCSIHTPRLRQSTQHKLSWTNAENTQLDSEDQKGWIGPGHVAEHTHLPSPASSSWVWPSVWWCTGTARRKTPELGALELVSTSGEQSHKRWFRRRPSFAGRLAISAQSSRAAGCGRRSGKIDRPNMRRASLSLLGLYQTSPWLRPEQTNPCVTGTAQSGHFSWRANPQRSQAEVAAGVQHARCRYEEEVTNGGQRIGKKARTTGNAKNGI